MSDPDKTKLSVSVSLASTPYYPEALRVVDAVLRSVSPDAATAFAMMVASRDASDDALPFTAEFFAACWPGLDINEAQDRMRKADDAVRADLGFNFLDPRSFWRAASSRLFQDDDEDPNVPVTSPNRLFASRGVFNLLNNPLPAAKRSDPPPTIDADTARWLATIAALVRSGCGAHLALRRGGVALRELHDLAALLIRQGLVVRALDCSIDDLPRELLRAELHAKETPHVILVDRAHLLVDGPKDEADDWDAPKAAAADPSLSSFAASAPDWLPTLRNVYLWRIPATGAFPASKLPFVGGCLGPMHHDPEWSRAIVADALARCGDSEDQSAARALMARLNDARDAGSLARVACAMARSGDLALDRACAIVAGSFLDRPSQPAPTPSGFDARLLVCDEEAHLLLARAQQAAANGARVLAWGPPGGGKSFFARALAGRMAGRGPVTIVTPSAILARGWGATERIIRSMWQRAANEGEILVVDEFEVICGVRDGESPSGNAYLIRCLTDEWLRSFDDYPDVPLIATVNDVNAVDDAARRRFGFVLEFKDALTPEQERLAWEVILHREPPPGWRPCGAAVADFALAARNCRMLALGDAQAHSNAVARARDARLGRRSPKKDKRPHNPILQ